jgi:hypothetical protein
VFVAVTFAPVLSNHQSGVCNRVAFPWSKAINNPPYLCCLFRFRTTATHVAAENGLDCGLPGLSSTKLSVCSRNGYDPLGA